MPDPNQQAAPQPQQPDIDLSAGLVPKAPTATPAVPSPTQQTGGDIDLSAGLVPKQVAQAPIEHPLISKIKEGISQSMPVQMIRSAIAPPEDPTEHLIYSVGNANPLSSGQGMLAAYRQAKGIVDSVTNMVKAPKETYQQAKQDLIRAAKDYHNKDYRNFFSDMTSMASDAMSVQPGDAGLGERTHELSEGARPGGNLATPVTKDIADLLTIYAGEHAPEAVDAAKKTVSKVGETVEDVANKAKAKAANNEVQKAATESASDFKKAIPASKTTPYTDADYQTARNYLERHHETVDPIHDVEGTRDALDHEVGKIENVVSSHIGIIPKEPIAADVMSDVRDALASSEKIKKGSMAQGLKELAPYNLENPTMEEADTIRRQLNAENKAVLKKNNYDVATARATDAGFAAREAAAESLRNGIYDQLEAHGIEGVKEMRQDEGALIRLRDAAQRQVFNGDKVVRGSGQASTAQKVAGKVAKTATTALGAGGGALVAGPGGAIVGGGIGAGVGELAERAIAPADISRDALIERSFGKKAATGAPTEPTVNLKAPEPKPAPKGQQELNLGPQDLFGVSQTPAVDQSTINQVMMGSAKAKPFRTVLEDPAATIEEKIEAARQLDKLGKFAKPGELPDVGTPEERQEIGKVPLSDLTAEPKADIKKEADAAAKDLGIESRGIQKDANDNPDSVIFQDPESKTSIAVKVKDWSPEQLQKQVDEARLRMSEVKPTKIYHSTGGDVNSIEDLDASKSNDHAVAGPGVYVTTDSSVAKAYTKANPSAKMLSGELKPGAKLIDMNGSLPKVVKDQLAKNSIEANTYKEAVTKIREEYPGNTTAAIKSFQKSLHRAGYDGVKNIFPDRPVMSVFGPDITGKNFKSYVKGTPSPASSIAGLDVLAGKK